MKYQLVLQFAAASTEDFDRLVALEDRLIGELDDLATVDGHDFGFPSCHSSSPHPAYPHPAYPHPAYPHPAEAGFASAKPL